MGVITSNTFKEILAKRTGLSDVQVENMLYDFADILEENIAKGNKIDLLHYGIGQWFPVLKKAGWYHDDYGKSVWKDEQFRCRYKKSKKIDDAAKRIKVKR